MWLWEIHIGTRIAAVVHVNDMISEHKKFRFRVYVGDPKFFIACVICSICKHYGLKLDCDFTAELTGTGDWSECDIQGY